MADKREQILVRIIAIVDALKAAGHFVTVKRNAMLTDQEQKPAFILLDGLEFAKLTNAGRSRPGLLVPQVQTMQPELYLLAKEPRPTGSVPGLQDPGNVGTVLNALRLRVTKALAEDATLRALIGANGEITMPNTETDLVAGGLMVGTMKIDLSISYVFDPLAVP